MHFIVITFMSCPGQQGSIVEISLGVEDGCRQERITYTSYDGTLPSLSVCKEVGANVLLPRWRRDNRDRAIKGRIICSTKKRNDR